MRLFVKSFAIWLFAMACGATWAQVAAASPVEDMVVAAE